MTTVHLKGAPHPHTLSIGGRITASWCMREGDIVYVVERQEHPECVCCMIFRKGKDVMVGHLQNQVQVIPIDPPDSIELSWKDKSC